MTTTEGSQPATEQWDAFALALAAPLGPFAQVHLAPKFPPHLLNAALATYLPLKEDELLLAIIDRGGRNELGPLCADNAPDLLDREGRQDKRPARTRTQAARPLRGRIDSSFGSPITRDLPDQHRGDRDPGRIVRHRPRRRCDHRARRGRRQAGVGPGTLSRNDGKRGPRGGCARGLIDPELAARAARALPERGARDGQGPRVRSGSDANSARRCSRRRPAR